MKRIGLFGGTFNPIHIGHLRAAVEVKEGFGLDAVHMIPVAIPPHKKTLYLAQAPDRLEMARLATAGLKNIFVSDFEANRHCPSYTIDTVEHFKTISGENDRLFLIIGSDAFLELHTWKSHLDLIHSVSFIILNRPGAIDDTGGLSAAIDRYLHGHLSSEYTFYTKKNCFLHRRLPHGLYITNITRIGVSSTHIRHLIQHGKSIRFLVTEPVCQYIQSKGLYQQ